MTAQASRSADTDPPGIFFDTDPGVGRYIDHLPRRRLCTSIHHHMGSLVRDALMFLRVRQSNGKWSLYSNGRFCERIPVVADISLTPIRVRDSATLSISAAPTSRNNRHCTNGRAAFGPCIICATKDATVKCLFMNNGMSSSNSQWWQPTISLTQIRDSGLHSSSVIAGPIPARYSPLSTRQVFPQGRIFVCRTKDASGAGPCTSP